MTTYRKAADRHEEILKSACKLAEQTHYRKIRRHHLVKICGTAAGNISRVMGSMADMRESLVKYAVENNIDRVVAQAIMDNHPTVKSLDINERRRILSSMA